jgi:tetrahydromethanopterin S-methyltransferase subunit F
MVAASLATFLKSLFSGATATGTSGVFYGFLLAANH